MHASTQVLEKPTCLARLSISSDDFPSSSGKGCVLGVYLPTLGLHDKIGAGGFNLDYSSAIPEVLCK